MSQKATQILEMDPARRSLADHAFILGLMKQRNDLREKLCKSWPAHQYNVLCKKLKIEKYIPFKKVRNYFVWAACVRVTVCAPVCV
jgi:hypothetical protein